jgi:uncharacterized protein YyaL (SSP411 family)
MNPRRAAWLLLLFFILGAGWWWMSQKPKENPITSEEEGSFKHTNRLIHEKSPYLLQHAHNPVDWFPWGEAAFEKAKKENKPIFLSIGYSTCHWCHVMEHESFEDEGIAKIMNDHFVCIKVDREERPDVDQIYMNAVMMLTGSGGWPLNVFLTPDLKPFYGGTYFAPDERYGRPGFPSVLEDVARVWKTKPDEVEKAGKQLTEHLSKTAVAPSGSLSQETLNQAAATLAQNFDSREGGFRGAPKFPPAMALQFLLRLHQKTGDKGVLPMVEITLDKMAQGGIYDQVGGGFSRYSTDNHWLVPHFEKMLYDNALLSQAYLEATQVTGREEYARIAREIFTYLLRDMTDPEGGFYSAEDADSEGVEGKFYVWTPTEIRSVLGEEDGKVFCGLYGVTEHGNFEEGQSILHLKTALPDALKATGKDEKWWKDAREKVLQARSKRIRPHRDDKILTAWNALMISSLTIGAQVLGDPAYLAAAEKASAFLSKNLVKNGRLLASYRQGPSDTQGFLDDYAFFQQALLDLYESTFDLSYLKQAVQLEKDMRRIFWDDANGGFYFTGNDQKDQHRLLARNKEAYDGVIPSGNSVAALNDFRLAEFTGQKEYRDTALQILKAFGGTVASSPSNFPKMLQAFQFDFYGPSEILVVGPRKESEGMLRLLWKTYLPNRVLVWAEDPQIKKLSQDIPWVEGRQSQGGKPTVYVCRNYQCQLPVTDERQVLKLIGESTAESR